MQILVINSGSSSLKFRLLNSSKNYELIAKGLIEKIGLRRSKVRDHKEALKLCLESLEGKQIDAVGHRVVHGGEKFTEPTKITPRVIREIKRLSHLAPLHNPANLQGILACKKILKRTPQVAVFDTAFHQTMPDHAYLYGLPEKLYKKHAIRRYGFHGTSHKYVCNEALKLLRTKKAKIITCHLGNGSSITATINGKSIDTSMGLTPLEGIMMGTRSGSIDPAIIIYLQKKLKLTPQKVDHLLNNESGLKGFSGISSDMRKIYQKSLKGNSRALLTIRTLSYQISKYLGAYFAAMQGVDAVVFTGGMGEKAFYIRAQAILGLASIKAKIDPRKNRKNELKIHHKDSKIKVFVIPTNEEKQIAIETHDLLAKI
ncbi:acetate kinase [Patescibacteria group bacterium]|nr:acetate kinase [Patescibacteria group bacterium]